MRLYLLIQIKVFKWRVFLPPELCQNCGCFWLACFFPFYFSLPGDEKTSNSVFNGDRSETVCCSRPLATGLPSSAVYVCVSVTSTAVISIQSEREPTNRACLWLRTAGVDMAAINIIKIITLTSFPSRSFPARKDPCFARGCGNAVSLSFTPSETWRLAL